MATAQSPAYPVSCTGHSPHFLHLPTLPYLATKAHARSASSCGAVLSPTSPCCSAQGSPMVPTAQVSYLSLSPPCSQLPNVRVRPQPSPQSPAGISDGLTEYSQEARLASQSEQPKPKSSCSASPLLFPRLLHLQNLLLFFLHTQLVSYLCPFCDPTCSPSTNCRLEY